MSSASTIASSSPTYTLQQLLDVYSSSSDPSSASTVQNPRTLRPSYDTAGSIVAMISQMLYDSTYLGTTVTNELARVSGVDASSRRDLYQARQSARSDAYSSRYYAFVSNVIVFTTFVTMLCLMLVCLMRGGTFGMHWATLWISVVLAVYTCCMLFAFSTVRMRSPGDWNQYTFQPNQTVLKAAGLVL